VTIGAPAATRVGHWTGGRKSTY